MMQAEQDILTGIDVMQHKIERLEAKVDEMRAVFERILLIAPPVVFTTPEGRERFFRPNRPVSVQTLATLAQVEQASQARRYLPDEERTDAFSLNLAEARARAIREGFAIDDEREAALGD